MTQYKGISRSKSIGRRKKCSRKKNESEEKPTEDHSPDIKNKSHSVVPSRIAGKDVGTSVIGEELGRNALEALPVVKENLTLIVDYLRLMLAEIWSISISKQNTIIISEIVHPQNPSIERALTWCREGKVNIFVRNMPLKSNHLLWQIRKPDAANCGAVADYLTSVANSFILLNVCSGVTSHEQFWQQCDSGIVQINFEPPCIRHFDCFLLLGAQHICPPCSKLKKTLRERERRTNQTATEESCSSSSVLPTANERFLDRRNLLKKLEIIRKDSKISKQKLRRLEKKIDKLLQEKSERIDSELSGDFVQIMNENSEKMSSIEKKFWGQQSKALSLSKRGASTGMRWHPAMIRLALHLRMLSPSAYDFLRGVISLPSQRRLFDYSQFVDVQEGVQQELLEQFKENLETKCQEEHQRYFSLLLDEMHIKADLVYSSRTGELIGFTNLTTLENVLRELEDEMKSTPSEKRLAKKVLVFMLTGATHNFRFVPAIFSTDDLSAAQLYTRTWEVIYAVEETGAKVLVVIFDGASVNRKFITLHFNMGSTDYVHVTINAASIDRRPLYFIVDPPHLIKTFRNCLANSYSHRKSRTLWKNNQRLSWKAIEALHEIIKEDKFKCTKLTKAHVRLTSFSCMKVNLAVQVLSKSVAEALLVNRDKTPLQAEFSQELVDFISLMNRTFDCLNGGVQSTKKHSNSDLMEYTSPNDTRLEFLKDTVLNYLLAWENDAANRPGKFSKEQRSRMMISYQSVEAMKITIHSFVGITKFLLNSGAAAVSGRNFNQDPLEQCFSTFRALRGSDDNPTLKQVLHTRLSLHAQGQGIAFGKRQGNTEVMKRELEVEEGPLPVRKKTKTQENL